MTIYDATAAIPAAVASERGFVSTPCPPTGGLPDEGFNGLWWYDRESSEAAPLTLCHYSAARVQPGLELVRDEAKRLAAARPGSRVGWISEVFNASQGFDKSDELRAAGHQATAATVAMIKATGLHRVFSVIGVYAYADPRQKATVYQSRLHKALTEARTLGLPACVFVTPWATETMGEVVGMNIHEGFHRIAFGLAADFGASVCAWGYWGPGGLQRAATGDYDGGKMTFEELEATDLWRVLMEVTGQ